jgi:hypothetical protein
MSGTGTNEPFAFSSCFACNTSLTIDSGDSEAKKNMIFFVSCFCVADPSQVLNAFVAWGNHLSFFSANNLCFYYGWAICLL